MADPPLVGNEPVVVENDANCLALSEATDGAAAGAGVVFAAIVGTGTGAGFNPTGLAFGPDGDVYVCGYAGDSVRRYDGTTRQLEATVVPPRAAGLDGADNGMTFGPDGRLYIPGYDANNVVAWDPATNQVSTFIARNAGGLIHPRGIVFLGRALPNSLGGIRRRVAHRLRVCAHRRQWHTIAALLCGQNRPAEVAWKRRAEFGDLGIILWRRNHDVGLVVAIRIEQFRTNFPDRFF